MKRLVVMAKVPHAGRVKTRLARGIGAVSAVRFYRSALNATVLRLSQTDQWRTVVAAAPDSARLSDYPFGTSADVRLLPQGSGDLGARLQRVFETEGAGPIVVIGSDIPGITRPLIAGAFAAVAGHDAVFGPSADGGFWLIGMRSGRRARKLFDGVRWSTEFALQDVRSALNVRSVALISPLDDVDERCSFRRLGSQAARIVPPMQTVA